MFIYDFISSVNIEVYSFSILILMLIVVACTFLLKQRVLHPVLIGDLLFFQSLLVYIYHADQVYFIHSFLLLLIYILSRVFGMIINLNFFYYQDNKPPNVQFGRNVFFLLTALSLIVLVSTLLYLKSLSQISTSFKLTWTLEMPALSFVYTFFLNSILVFFPLYFINKRRGGLDKVLAFLVFVFVIYNAALFHMKGYFLFLILSMFFYFYCKGEQISKFYLFFVFCFFLLYLSFFYNIDNSIKLVDRFLKNADGSFIFLEYGLYDGSIDLAYNVYVYFMKFFFFKFLPSQEIGQEISSFAPYVHAEGGGVNDHLLIYLFLGGGVDGLLIIIFLIVYNITILPLLGYLKNSSNLFLFGIGGYIYLNSFLVFQMPSGFFLSFSKYFICLFFSSLFYVFFKFFLFNNANKIR